MGDPIDSDRRRPNRADTSVSRRRFLGTVAAGGAVVTGATTVGAQSDAETSSTETAATVDPPDQVYIFADRTVVAPGKTVSADIELTESPIGMCPYERQPYEITVEVDDPTAARIVDLELPGDYDLDPTIEDGQTATLGVNADHWYTALGDKPPLGIVTLEGETAGESATITASIRYVEDDCLAWDGTQTFDVRDTAPDPPTNLHVSSGSFSTFEVFWDHPSDACGSVVDHYVVSANGTDVKSVPAGVTATTVDADGLGIPVTVGVRAVGTTTGTSDSVTAEHTPAHADPGSLLTPVPAADPVTVGESTTVAIDAQPQMGSVPDLDSITVSLATPCTAEMTGGAVADRFEGTATVADDGTSVTLDWSAFPNGADRNGTVATVEVTGRQASHTRVLIDDVTTTSDGHVGTEWATLGVEEPVPTIPGGIPGNAPSIDGTVPRDVDGDGLHEDFNADGEINFPDVSTFFQHSDADVVQNNASYFDFTEDGTISIQDVMALFRMV